jgi:hypothetical protein
VTRPASPAQTRLEKRTAKPGHAAFGSAHPTRGSNDHVRAVYPPDRVLQPGHCLDRDPLPRPDGDPRRPHDGGADRVCAEALPVRLGQLLQERDRVPGALAGGNAERRHVRAHHLRRVGRQAVQAR